MKAERVWYAALVLAVALSGCASPQSKPPFHVTIQVGPDQVEQDILPVWLGYLMARANYVSANKALYVGETGVIRPRFEEEVEARTTAAQLYKELGGGKRPDPYFKDLVKVEQASLMREYVWAFLRQPTWKDDQQPGKLNAFEVWARNNIPDHQVVTYGGIALQPN